MFHHGREKGIDGHDVGDLAALADVLGDLGAGVLDLAFAAGGGHDLKGAEDGHAGTHECGIGAAEAGERDLVDEVAEDGRLDEKHVLLATAVGRRDVFAAEVIDAVGAEAEGPPPFLHEITEVDEHLRGQGQLGAEIGEHGREHGDDENQQHVDQRDRKTDDRDRVGHGGLHLLGQLDGGLEVAGHLAENLGESAGRLTRLDHGDEEIREHPGESLDGRRKGCAGGNIVAHIANHDAEHLILRLILQGFETGDEGQAGLQQGGQLAGEYRKLPKVELVGFGSFLKSLLFGHRLRRFDTGLCFSCRWIRHMVAQYVYSTIDGNPF